MRCWRCGGCEGFETKCLVVRIGYMQRRLLLESMAWAFERDLLGMMGA